MRAALAIAVLLLVGCENPNKPAPTELDQCMRFQLFRQCMASLPAGPSSTRYNDWAEVVSECEDVATRAAYRDPQFIAPACRSSGAP